MLTVLYRDPGTHSAGYRVLDRNLREESSPWNCFLLYTTRQGHRTSSHLQPFATIEQPTMHHARHNRKSSSHKYHQFTKYPDRAVNYPIKKDPKYEVQKSTMAQLDESTCQFSDAEATSTGGGLNLQSPNYCRLRTPPPQVHAKIIPLSLSSLVAQRSTTYSQLTRIDSTTRLTLTL